MSELSRFQDAFAAAMTSGGSAALGDFVANEAELARFAVYRNNFVSAAVGALRKNFPAVEALVGAAFFAAAARGYVEAAPPRARTLTFYGEGFPDFLGAFPPAQSLPYLCDVARIDRAYLTALFAPEAPALAAEKLMGTPSEAMAALAPGLHPSARVVGSDHPAYAIWRTCREDDEPKPVAAHAGPQAALVWRPEADVRHRVLSRGERAFFAAVDRGAILGEAAEAGFAAEPGFDLMTTLAGALAANVLADIP